MVVKVGNGVGEEEEGEAFLSRGEGGEEGGDGRRTRSRRADARARQRRVVCPPLPLAWLGLAWCGMAVLPLWVVALCLPRTDGRSHRWTRHSAKQTDGLWCVHGVVLPGENRAGWSWRRSFAWKVRKNASAEAVGMQVRMYFLALWVWDTLYVRRHV